MKNVLCHYKDVNFHLVEQMMKARTGNVEHYFTHVYRFQIPIFTEKKIQIQ